MEKKGEANSVVMGYDDSHSTYSLEQPPPAYRKSEASSVKVAKVIAATIIVLSVIIGAVVLGAVYIQTKNQCILIPQQGLYDTIGTAESAPVPESLVQSPPAPQSASSVKKEETSGGASTTTAAESREDKDVDDDRRENDVDRPDHMHIPLQLDLDDITGQIMENNQRARVNCVIEKKKAEEIVTQSPKHLRTPFGNLTTDHRYMHITGETMTLSCRSGNARIMRPVQVDDDEPQEGPTAILIQTQPLPVPMQAPIQMRMGGGMPQHPGMQQPHNRMQQPHPGMQHHPNMHQHHPDMQQRPPQQMHNNQPHPMFPPQLMMGPGGPMLPPQHAGMMMNGPHGMREPRAPEHNMRVKRSAVPNKLACSCTSR